MNPFAALDIQDDEQEFTKVPQQPKPHKKTHQERKEAKEKKIKEAQLASNIPVNVNENITETSKGNKSKHYKEKPVAKGVSEGHTYDRRSGTGRQDRPRKEGGGKGNIGNIKDELNKDKYLKEDEKEEKQNQETEEKPEEPQPLTLEEYYRAKGIQIDESDVSKKVAKKGEIHAEWIKKENLTVMKTKEDLRLEAQTAEYSKKELNEGMGAQQVNSQILGFGQKPVQRHERKEREREREDEKPHPKKKKFHDKVVLKEEDFPSL